MYWREGFAFRTPIRNLPGDGLKAGGILNRVQNDSFLCKSQLGLYYMGPMAHSWLVNILESRQQNDIYVTHSTLLNHEWVLFTPQKNLKACVVDQTYAYCLGM
jgi:hypothetical protein